MNLKKIKEILKTRKVQIITGTVAGVLALTVAGTIILNNKNVENKNIIVEKDDKKVSNEENIEIKEQLEELKSIDTANMSDEEKIDAYETSILPYEDCCTIFVAKHPVTKPNLNVIHNDERKLSEKIDALMQEAIDTVEVIHIEG